MLVFLILLPFLLLVIFGAYLLVCLFVRQNNLLLKKTKQLYNNLKLSNFNCVISPFQLLRNEKQALEQSIKVLKQFQIKFDNEINSAFEQLTVYSKPNNIYRFIWFNRNIKLLNKNLQHLYTKQQEYINLTKNAIVYFNNSYDCLVFYRQAFCFLNQFINNFLIEKYDSLFYLNVLNRISLLFKEIENCIQAKDVEKQIAFLNKLHNILSQTIITANRQYMFDIKLSYLTHHFKVLIQKVKQMELMKNKVINSQDLLKLHELINNITIKLKDCTNFLNNLNLMLCERNMDEVQEAISWLFQAVSSKEKSINLVVENIDDFRNQIQQYEKKNELLKTTIKAIELVFQNETDVHDLIIELNENCDLITKNINNLNHQSLAQNQINYEKLFYLMSQTNQALEKLKNSLTDLLNLAVNKFDEYRFFVYTLDDFRFKFFQIENLISDQDLKVPAKTLQVINKSKLELDNIFTEANNNYLGTFNLFSEKIDLLQIQLTEVICDVVSLVNLRLMCKQAFLFANKYRQKSSHIDRSLEQLTKLYNQQNYPDTLEGLINLLTKIKTNTKQDYLELN